MSRFAIARDIGQGKTNRSLLVPRPITGIERHVARLVDLTNRDMIFEHEQ